MVFCYLLTQPTRHPSEIFTMSGAATGPDSTESPVLSQKRNRWLDAKYACDPDRQATRSVTQSVIQRRAGTQTYNRRPLTWTGQGNG